MEIEIIVVGLVGGVADNARSAVCVDLDRGNAREDWAALVRADRVARLEEETGAEVVWQRPWDGSRFGDGNGVVERLEDGSIAGDGLYAKALI